MEANKPAIPINIWDDFYDDGYVPAGETQRTHAYVENYEMDEELKERALRFFFDRLAGHPLMRGVTMQFTGDEIEFHNLTHKKLDGQMGYLDKNPLQFEDYTLDIYSES